MGLYHNIPCSQCRDCQYFSLVDHYYDTPHCCDKKLDPTEDVYKYKVRDPNTTDANWYIDTDGTYPGECRNFKRKNNNSNSEKKADKVQAEGDQKFAAFIGKLISFPISGFGYVFAISLIIGLISGGGLFPTSLWVWAGGPLVLGILIGILKAKTKIVGKILYVIGFLLIAVVFILSKVLPQG